ncbi:hypothetical protein [Streptomyces sp. NPDC096033]|uniref:hypothetical protein n=1 Tax=Streptomyces sp. NPDC096033 TaxID=3366071 RepID=UPI003808F232
MPTGWCARAGPATSADLQPPAEAAAAAQCAERVDQQPLVDAHFHGQASGTECCRRGEREGVPKGPAARRGRAAGCGAGHGGDVEVFGLPADHDFARMADEVDAFGAGGGLFEARVGEDCPDPREQHLALIMR